MTALALANQQPLLWRNGINLAIGIMLAMVAIVLCAFFEHVALLSTGGFLLLPAGSFIAIGASRLFGPVCRAAGIRLPALPAALQRKVSFRRMIRSAKVAVSRLMKWTRKPVFPPASQEVAGRKSPQV